MDHLKVVEIIISVFASLSFLIAAGFNDFKKYWFKILIILIPFSFGLIILNYIFYYLKIESLIGLSFILTLFLPEFILLIVLLIIAKRKIHLLSIFTANLNAFLCFYMMFIIKSSFGPFVDNPQVLTIIIYLISTPILFLYLRFVFIRLQQIVEEYSPKQLWLLTLYTVAIIGEIVVYALLLNLTKEKILRFSIFNAAILSVYFISIFGFFVFLNDYKNKNLRLMNQTVNKKQLGMIVSYVKKQKDNENKLRIVKHDMRHILNNIASLIQTEKYDEALSIINSYNEVIDSSSFVQYCKDPIINAILCYFKSKCDEQQIPFTIKVNNFEDYLDIPLEDISLIISNILDNAYNAATKASEPFINFKFLENKGRLILQVTNRYSGKIIYDADHLPTSSSKNHGTGSKSIRYYAKKNNLFVDYQIKENIFTITILFNE